MNARWRPRSAAVLALAGVACYLFPNTVEVEARDGRSWLVTPDSIQGGNHSLAFEVTNSGSETHRVVVALTDFPPDELPVEGGSVRAGASPGSPELTVVAPLDGNDRIDPGGTLSFEHGQSGGTGTGTFVVYCNVKGHYERGEYAVLTVDP
jgi:uncharacterized cupredoxin-like copper-binding protein